MVDLFDIDLSGLVLDMTNFATYIDSANDRAPIAQRGHAKQKRTDLRLVGLGLVVSVDGGIPLVSHAYAGDRRDVTQFGAMVNELVARWGALVVTHSPTLHAKQAAGFTQTLTKAGQRLTELTDRLARGKTRRGHDAVEADIVQILAPRWVSRVITTTLTANRPATFALTWAIDTKARRALESEQFGKRILFTDHDDWSHARVVAGYRSQSSTPPPAAAHEPDG